MTFGGFSWWLPRVILPQQVSLPLCLPGSCSGTSQFRTLDIRPCGPGGPPRGAWSLRRTCPPSARYVSPGKPCQSLSFPGGDQAESGKVPSRLYSLRPLDDHVIGLIQGPGQTPATGVSSETQRCSSRALWLCLLGEREARAGLVGRAPLPPMAHPQRFGGQTTVP